MESEGIKRNRFFPFHDCLDLVHTARFTVQAITWFTEMALMSFKMSFCSRTEDYFDRFIK